MGAKKNLKIFNSKKVKGYQTRLDAIRTIMMVKKDESTNNVYQRLKSKYKHYLNEAQRNFDFALINRSDNKNKAIHEVINRKIKAQKKKPAKTSLTPEELFS